MDNMTIVTLRGPDRVRKRPAVIFGSEGIEGAVKAVKALIDIFVTEAAFGFSRGIDVTIHKDNSISVYSFDRGFVLDETVIDGKPAWHYDFCEMYPEPREPDENCFLSLGSKHNDLYGSTEAPLPKYQVDSDRGFDLCCVQYVSEFMRVEAIRDGIKKALDFKKGYSVSELVKESTTRPNGTFIHFLLDKEVFESVIIENSYICSYLQEIAVSVPSLKCKLCDEREEAVFTYHYPRGAYDYLSEISWLTMPLYVKELEATGKDRYNGREYDARVKIHFGFVKERAKITCLHNYRILKSAGSHLRAVEEKILRYVNWEFIWDFKDSMSSDEEKSYNSKSRFELSFEDIKDNLVLILETNCSKYASYYENGARTSISNRMITDMASDLIGEDFRYYLKQNHDTVFPILEKIQKEKSK